MEGNVFSIVWKTFRARLSKPQSTSSQGSLGDKILYWKRFFLSPFSDRGRKFFGFCVKKINRLINIAYYVSLEEIGREENGRWKKKFPIWKKNCRRLVKTSIHMFMRTVWTENIFGTISLFIHFRTVSGKKFGFCQNRFGRVVKIAFYVSIGKIRG